MTQLEFLLNKELEGRLAVMIEAVAKGVPTDFAEYCKLVGEIRGLQYAQQALLKARREANPDEDTDV